ncbi:MAG: hypothetical protein WBB28_27190 [Crinalium sp.]
MIIRQEQDGVEFFTIQATGESGMSQSGLARLCGTEPRRIAETLSKAVGDLNLPESLKPLQGKDFELAVGSSYKNATVIADWAIACIVEYYALDARKPTEEAKYAYRQFAKMGVRSWIQGITGWSHCETQVQPSDDDDLEALVKTTETLARMTRQMVEHKRELKKQQQQIEQILANQQKAEAFTFCIYSSSAKNCKSESS